MVIVDNITIGREKFPILQGQREVLKTISENDNVWFRLDRRVVFSSAMVDYANRMADVGCPVYYFVDSEHTLKNIHDNYSENPKSFIEGGRKDKFIVTRKNEFVTYYVASPYVLIGKNLYNSIVILDNADLYIDFEEFFRNLYINETKRIIVGTNIDNETFDTKFKYCFKNFKQKTITREKNRNMEKNVDHPQHYNLHPSGIECIEIAKHYDFCIGNAIKYLWRSGLKSEEGMSDQEKEIEDLEKAVWYIKERIKTLKENG